MPSSPSIVWFRRDFRFDDNPALAAAAEAGGAVLPVYIHSPEEDGDWGPGAAAKWWLHQALRDLDGRFREIGGRLILRSGDGLEALRDIAARSGATRIFWNRRYEPRLVKRDAAVKRALREDGLTVASFNASLLHEPHTVGVRGGRPYKVFTPYWKAVRDRKIDPPVALDPRALRFPAKYPRTEALDSLGLLPAVQWYRKLQAHWEVGEAAARRRLSDFLGGAVDAYDGDRDRPDLPATSRLSPYLHWGHVGPRRVMHDLREAHDLRRKGPQAFAREIHWREFAHHVLYHFPETPERPLHAKFEGFPWRHDAATLARWQKGRTGYPMVDAAMRELWATGWMHNRARMIVSSLLVKHLLHNWTEGTRWFWDTLVDADLANNTLGWQWSGGCGADAAPYFRIFNPILQGRKFDPDGAYVRRWVPELKRLPTAHIHAPWEAPPAVLSAAGVRLGENYPTPVIGHREGRERALEAFQVVKSRHDDPHDGVSA